MRARGGCPAPCLENVRLRVKKYAANCFSSECGHWDTFNSQSY